MALTTEQCAAPGCTNFSTPKGEHVLPEWMLRAFTSSVWSPGPYRAESSKTGVERTSEQGVLTKLPCCSLHNRDLNTNFEQHGKAAAKRLFGVETTRRDAQGRSAAWEARPLEALDALDAAESDAFARWLVKTMVLNGHPASVREMNGQRVWSDRKPAGFPESVFSDVFSGRVPEGMNAWIAVAEPDAVPERHLDVAPRVSLDAAVGFQTASVSWGLGLRHGDGGRSLDVNVVWGPGMIVLHPDEESGAATRIWPRPPARLRIADLPVLDAAAASRFRSTFYSGGGGWVHKPGRTPVIAGHISTLAATPTADGFDLGYLDFIDTPARVAEVEAHLRRIGVLYGEITEHGRLTG